MQTRGLLVTQSLQETLWRLEEARCGFRAKAPQESQEALRWILSRQGLPGSYRGSFFAPTRMDFSEGLRLLTGEKKNTRAGASHILGEEALRALALNPFRMKAVESGPYERALEGFEGVRRWLGDSGGYCCYICSVAAVRALVAVKPNKWETILNRSLDRIKKARSGDGKWHGYPYHYTLLTLSEMDVSSARAELRYASRSAARLIDRYRGDDRTSRFRRRGLDASLNAV